VTAVIAVLSLMAHPLNGRTPDTVSPACGLSTQIIAWDKPVAVPETEMECGEPGALSVTTMLAAEDAGERKPGA
jgi:hypothetical protein